MKRTNLLLLILLVPAALFAQKEISAFGKIDKTDLELKACPFEKDAPAMILFDIEETNFDVYTYGGSKSKIERRVRIKIFNEKGYPYASIKIPYISKRGIGKMRETSGMVYNLDDAGNIVTQKLGSDDFNKVKAMKNLGLVSFTFPNVKPGSVIEYTYTSIEKNIAQIDPWLIQSEIPNAYSAYIVTTPVTSGISEKLFGNDSVDKRVDLLKYDQLRRTTYFKENIPSFKPEPFMSSEKDNITKMIFHLSPRIGFTFSEWASVGRFLLNAEFFGGQIRKIVPGTESLIDSAKNISSVPVRIKYIYDAVKNRIPNITEQTLYAEDLNEAWNARYCNTAEINMILLNLLQKALVTSYALLISTRDNGKVSKDFPSFGQLNGVDVVAMLDSTNYYLLDASLKFQPLSTPPFNILNREVLLLKPDNIGWFMISDNRPLVKESTNIIADFSEKGTIEGTVSTQYYDYSKSFKLDTIEKNKSLKEEKFLDTKEQDLKILSVTQDSLVNDKDPLFEKVSYKYTPQQSGDFYFISPHFMGKKDKNSFTAKNRLTNIDLGANQQLAFSLLLFIPPGFQTEAIPKNATVWSPDSSFYFNRSYSKDDESITISEVFEVKKCTFQKEEYPNIAEFFRNVYTLMEEQIILKKKK